MCGFQGTREYKNKRGCAESSQVGGCGYKATQPKPRGRRTAQALDRIPVTMAKGIHLFPYRTQKLSLSAPMVLGWRRPGRVGRCRIPKQETPHEMGCFLFWNLTEYCSRAVCGRVHALYLARFFPMRAQWDRSLARPVGDTARRSVGNRKERPGDATVRVPRRKRARWETSGRELLPGRLRVSACIVLG